MVSETTGYEIAGPGNVVEGNTMDNGLIVVGDSVGGTIVSGNYNTITRTVLSGLQVETSTMSI